MGSISAEWTAGSGGLPTQTYACAQEAGGQPGDVSLRPLGSFLACLSKVRQFLCLSCSLVKFS